MVPKEPCLQFRREQRVVSQLTASAMKCPVSKKKRKNWVRIVKRAAENIQYRAAGVVCAMEEAGDVL